MIKQSQENQANDFKQHANDTGSTEVQIISLTNDINRLTTHFKAFPKDFNSKRGLMQMVGRRKRFLTYLKRTNKPLYDKLIARLEIRG
jgi:small subunit ribosomal protein S15